MTDTFISYSRKNQVFVERLVESLIAKDNEIWFDKNDIPYSSIWWDEIKHGIETSASFLFVLSPDSVKSEACNAEIATALKNQKRIIPIMYCGDMGRNETWEEIDKALDSNYTPDHKLPQEVQYLVRNLDSLARDNYLKIIETQIVFFEDDFEKALYALIEGLDYDSDWRRTWSQFRQTVNLWKESNFDEKYLWPEARLKPIRENVRERQLQSDLDKFEEKFIEPEQDRLLRELEDINTTHQHRVDIGKRLSVIGDMRSGVGIDSDGVPDIEWLRVASTGIVDIKGQMFATNPFYIAKYMITYSQFQAFIDDLNGIENKQWWQGLTSQNRQHAISSQQEQFDNYPRDTISWFQCVAFTRWLNTKLSDETLPDNVDASWIVRLPTEGEFQWAAQGCEKHLQYPWGEWDARQANTKKANIGDHSTAVGMYPHGSAECNAMDMSGNLWEWCLNEYDNPNQISMDSNNARVTRGGSFYHSHLSATCSSRNKANPNDRNINIGFRVVWAQHWST